MKQVNLENIADGVASELFAHELEKVAANICDLNTNWKTKRSISLTFTFMPDENREETKIVVEAKSRIAQIKPYAKTAYLGKRNGKATVFAQDTKQADLFDQGVVSVDSARKVVTNA